MGPYTNFGSRLRQLRKKAGLTQRELAAAAGVDFTYISKMENQRLEHLPSATTICKMAERLHANAQELLRLAGKVPKDALKRITFLEDQIAELRKIVAFIVQTNGTANCYDRYCRDDEWTYCIFCEEGDFDPHSQSHWKHKPDCILVQARALLDLIDGVIYEG